VVSAQDELFVDMIYPTFSRDWKYISSRVKRPLNSIVLDNGIKELLLEDAREFMRSKQWYTDRGTSVKFSSASR
jgi:mitochondrial chaperone BCS1